MYPEFSTFDADARVALLMGDDPPANVEKRLYRYLRDLFKSRLVAKAARGEIVRFSLSFRPSFYFSLFVFVPCTSKRL